MRYPGLLKHGYVFDWSGGGCVSGLCMDDEIVGGREMQEEKTRWLYRCVMRPPSPGAVPRDGLINCDFTEWVDLHGKHYWGRVVYNRRLTKKEIADYELEYVPPWWNSKSAVENGKRL